MNDSDFWKAPGLLQAEAKRAFKIDMELKTSRRLVLRFTMVVPSLHCQTAEDGVYASGHKFYAAGGRKQPTGPTSTRGKSVLTMPVSLLSHSTLSVAQSLSLSRMVLTGPPRILDRNKETTTTTTGTYPSHWPFCSMLMLPQSNAASWFMNWARRILVLGSEGA